MPTRSPIALSAACCVPDVGPIKKLVACAPGIWRCPGAPGELHLGTLTDATLIHIWVTDNRLT